jgi:hypothetical protein
MQDTAHMQIEELGHAINKGLDMLGSALATPAP